MTTADVLTAWQSLLLLRLLLLLLWLGSWKQVGSGKGKAPAATAAAEAATVRPCMPLLGLAAAVAAPDVQGLLQWLLLLLLHVWVEPCRACCCC